MPERHDLISQEGYDLIVIDPPWPEIGGGGRGAQNHYRVMSYADIPRAVLSAPCFVPMPKCWFGIWATKSSLPAALSLLTDSIGARYVTAWTWTKLHLNGNRAMGMGQYGRHSVEMILWGKRGTIGRGPKAQQVHADFAGDRGEHSEKPQAFYHNAKLAFAHTRALAMFERTERPGYDVWGDEAPE